MSCQPDGSLSVGFLSYPGLIPTQSDRNYLTI